MRPPPSSSSMSPTPHEAQPRRNSPTSFWCSNHPSFWFGPPHNPATMAVSPYSFLSAPPAPFPLPLLEHLPVESFTQSSLVLVDEARLTIPLPRALDKLLFL
ncbi:hypothetical protein HPP92_025945 [Vanilla planifolia]|uniref:Uncharacterized protein n=1 Tax=Vanilla planifolia TaxID=51239 RepID=A0A835PHG5_VANPL|nr:hypothetical protein HPP92_025945 [Vanilla planifolia]